MWKHACGFLARLRRNVAGNTLAMAAAALIPLIAAVGGAVDISRYYMATARLQAACDAGALAARKKMGDNTWEEADKLHGLAFFDQNYADGTFGIKNLTRDFTADANGTVTGTASGDLPTTLMEIFDFGKLDLSVTCSAEINISNTDIMFVIDVTGSMNCDANGTACSNGNNGNVEHATARIKGLRTAVMTFYDTVEDATSSSAQVRYGMVPYASNVNVGAAIPSQYMANTLSNATVGSMPTREAEWETNTTETRISFQIDSVYNRGADVFDYYWWNPNGESGVSSSAACDTRAANSTLGFTDNYVTDSLENVSVVSESWNGDLRTRVITARGDFTKAVPVAWWSSGYNPPCFVDLRYYDYEADFQATIVDRVETTRTFLRWKYSRTGISHDISSLYDDNMVTLPTGNNGADQTHSWDGCILEAQTVTTGVWDPLPSGAYDLDINLIPETEAQRWKPSLRNLWFKMNNGSDTRSDFTTTSNSMNKPGYDCPQAAFRLTDISRSDLQAYVDAISPISSTYHDIGMIWGARFISPRGIFAADNATAPNGDAIGRHIVFMTDGLMSTNTSILTPYGIEWWDRKISGDGNGSTTSTRHAARFQAACKQARQENISVWVVAFGTALSQNLIDCATPGRAFHASNSAELEDKFEEIAQRIAALRLTS